MRGIGLSGNHRVWKLAGTKDLDANADALLNATATNSTEETSLGIPNPKPKTPKPLNPKTPKPLNPEGFLASEVLRNQSIQQSANQSGHNLYSLIVRT